MRLQSHLLALEQQASRRVSRLKVLVADRTSFDDPEIDRRTAFVAIESMNLWSSYCRFFYLSAALGAKDSGGTRIVSSAGRFRSQDDALTFVIHRVRPNLKSKSAPWSWFDEPKWGDPTEFGRAVGELGPSNLGAVQAAISLQTDVFLHLPKFRNFYAHRAAVTARKVRGVARDYLMSPTLHPTWILNGYAPSRPQTILCDWLDDLKTVIELMA